MVGRRKVIASRHRRPIRCHPHFGFLAGLEHLDHFAGCVDGAEHHGGLAELLDFDLVDFHWMPDGCDG
jgi:hypothetical protein